MTQLWLRCRTSIIYVLLVFKIWFSYFVYVNWIALFFLFILCKKNGLSTLFRSIFGYCVMSIVEVKCRFAYVWIEFVCIGMCVMEESPLPLVFFLSHLSAPRLHLLRHWAFRQ